MTDDTGAQHAVVGDLDEPTTLPETSVDEQVLVEEKKMAKYSKTAEFKRLRDFMEARMKFYQRFLPSGSRVEGDPKDAMKVTLPEGLTPEMLSAYWIAACLVTKEFENVLTEYDQAREAVKNA